MTRSRYRSRARRAVAGVAVVLALQLLQASPVLQATPPLRAATAGAATDPAPHAGTAPRAEPRAAWFTGLGFDACAAPSIAALEAWSRSPFRALNIYIGGRNRACRQPHLSATWVREATHLGWRLIPTYVGLQAPAPGCPCAAMDPDRARAEGSAAAASAVQEAAALGIGRYNPIYDDMENYVVGKHNTAAVLAFLSGWTNGLHRSGYYAGVYGGATSGISDLASVRSTSYREPDDIWIAAWNGRRTTNDPNVPASLWIRHQRIHQYVGPHTDDYGGVRINIDTDYCDGAVVTFASLHRR